MNSPEPPGFHNDLLSTCFLIAFIFISSFVSETSIEPSKMKGVIIEKPEAPWKVVEGIDVPEPSDDHILVKSIATAINPV